MQFQLRIVLRRLERNIHPHARSAPSAIFQPRPSQVDLERMRPFYSKDDKGYFCSVELTAWDSGSDTAALNLISDDGSSDPFQNGLTPCRQGSATQHPVMAIGYGEMHAASKMGPCCNL